MSLPTGELARGETLVDLLRQHGVSKYNVGTIKPFTPPADGRSLVLVVGGGWRCLDPHRQSGYPQQRSAAMGGT